MKSPPDNWGDDILERIPVEHRANYLKWRSRIRACDENDEIIAVTGYIDANTRINLDTSDHMEGAAKSSEALAVRIESAVLRYGQMMERMEQLRKETEQDKREIEQLRHRERLSARYRRILKRRFFLSVALVSILVSAILCGLMEFHTLSDEKEVRKQTFQQVTLAIQRVDKEREEEINLIELDAGPLKWLKSHNISLRAADVTFTDGTKGFYLYSPSAVFAQMSKDANGQPFGAIYFRATADGN